MHSTGSRLPPPVPPRRQEELDMAVVPEKQSPTRPSSLKREIGLIGLL